MTWPVQAGGSSYEKGYGITSLSDCLSIITSKFTGTASFGDTALTSAHDKDAFICKFNSKFI